MIALVDTNVVVALVDPTDALHARASADLAKLAKADLRVTSAVLSETTFLLPRPDQRGRLALLAERLPIAPMLIDDESVLRRAVFAWLVKFADHTPDYADAELCILAGGPKRPKIWTYDSEFKTTWRTPAGRRPSVIGEKP